MNILIYNWRDIKNPLSGGAEILTHEMAKRWVNDHHRVTWFSSSFENAKKKEIIDGVNIVRSGKPDLRYLFNSVHFKAFLFYLKNKHKKFDVVIDEVHGIPFFTPLYVKEPIVVLICEVAKDIWDKMFRFPWNLIGKNSEYLILQLYKRRNVLTISESTRKDLLDYGFKSNLIKIIPMGINRTISKNSIKEKDLTLIFVARVNKMKGIEDAIESVYFIKKTVKTVKLWVVGKGETSYIKKLKDKINALGLRNNITFFGFVSDDKKFELMSRSHFIVTTSIREGFGLIIPEANSVETPVVSYNSPGLRDIVNRNNGYIIKSNKPEDLAKVIIRVYKDKKLFNNLKKTAKQESLKYDWDNTAKKSMQIIKSI